MKQRFLRFIFYGCRKLRNHAAKIEGVDAKYYVLSGRKQNSSNTGLCIINGKNGSRKQFVK